MREILFRGKRRDNGEWIEGYLSKIFFAHKEYWAITRKEVVGRYAHATEYDFVSYEVYPETIGQYTGIDDKNGKKVFEGDIVAGAVHWLERMKNGFVAFKDGSFGLIWYRGEVAQFNPFTSMCNVEYEVIGNIHDNPELLNGDE